MIKIFNNSDLLYEDAFVFNFSTNGNSFINNFDVYNLNLQLLFN